MCLKNGQIIGIYPRTIHDWTHQGAQSRTGGALIGRK